MRSEFFKFDSVIDGFRGFVKKSGVQSLLWLFLALAALALKLLLVSGNEILAEQYDPATYAAQSVGQAYMAFPPAYPWWLKISAAFGVPQRIFIEVVFFAALSFAFFKTRKFAGFFTAALMFVLVFFGPISLFVFDHLLSEGLYICLVLTALALSVCCIRSETIIGRVACFLILGGTLGVMALVRNEIPLLLVWGIVLGVIVGFKSINLLGWRKKTISACVFSLLSVVGLYVVFWGNSAEAYISEGVFTPSLPQLPSHLSLLKQLAEIDDGQAGLRFIPVTKKARLMAYSVSPTLRELSETVESPSSPFQTASKDMGLPEGEIGAGWIWHTFNAALGVSGRVKAKEIDAFYSKAGAELDLAFERGVLNKKRKFISLLSFGENPISTFFSSFWRVLNSSVSYIGYAEDPGYQSKLFDKVAVRRSSVSAGGGESVLQGWVAVRGAPAELVVVDFKNSEGSVLRVLPDLFDRQDVRQGLLSEKRDNPHVVGFRARSATGGYRPVKISYQLSSGKVIEVKEIVGGRAALLSDPQDLDYVIHGIDGLTEGVSQGRDGVGHSYQVTVVDFFSGRAWGLISLMLVSVGVLFSVLNIFFRKNDNSTTLSWVYIFVFIVFLSRICFYSLVDAGGWFIQLRYMQPAGVMVFVMCALSFWFVFDFLFAGVNGFKPART